MSYSAYNAGIAYLLLPINEWAMNYLSTGPITLFLF